MSDLVEKLRAAQEHAAAGEMHLGDAGLYGMAADEIERLQSLVGAVSRGQSLAKIRASLTSSNTA